MGECGTWQRRYWEHAIRDSGDLERHVNYIHGNPVKHGLVADIDDWPHSSWHRWEREYTTSLPPMPEDWSPAGERAASQESKGALSGAKCTLLATRSWRLGAVLNLRIHHHRSAAGRDERDRKFIVVLIVSLIDGGAVGV